MIQFINSPFWAIEGMTKPHTKCITSSILQTRFRILLIFYTIGISYRIFDLTCISCVHHTWMIQVTACLSLILTFTNSFKHACVNVGIHGCSCLYNTITHSRWAHIPIHSYRWFFHSRRAVTPRSECMTRFLRESQFNFH